MPIFGFRRGDGSSGSLPLSISAKRHVRELYTPVQMQHILRRERARADRGGSRFSLVLFKLDQPNFKERNLLRLATVVLRAVRETDEVGRFDQRTLCVVLPDTAPGGAGILINRVREKCHDTDYLPGCTVYTYPDAPADSDGPGDSDTGMGLNVDAISPGDSDVQPAPKSTNRFDRQTDDDAPRDYLRLDAGNADEHKSRSPENNGNNGPSGTASALLERPATRPQANTVLHMVEARPLADLLAQPLPWWKRSIDILASSIGILCASPLLIGAALAIKWSSPGPIMFLQNRTGLGGKPFKIYKFRTMIVDAEKKQAELRAVSEQDGPAFKMKKDPRITPIGAFLRKTSIDELPQLFNILKGDMTLVGPRPLPVGEAQKCEGWYAHRHDITPGLTCIWQVHGRSRVKFDEWMRMDMRYARRRRLFHDLALVLKTIPAVLLRRGAN